jgi:hypothetical protein
METIRIPIADEVILAISGTYCPPIPARYGDRAWPEAFDVEGVHISEASRDVDLAPLLEALERAIPSFRWMSWAEQEALDALALQRAEEEMERVVAGASA